MQEKNRAILFDLKGKPVFSSQKEFTQYFPKSGWVEHDPLEIMQTVKSTITTIFERNKIILPVVRCELKFIKPLVFGDYFSINVFCSKKPTSTIEFNYEIFNDNNELTTEGITTLAFLDSLTRKPLRCPKILSELF